MDARVLEAVPRASGGGGLVDALRDPACYPHPAGEVEVRETHISWVLLAGEFAYKVKKPVRLPFLDFSTLAQRRHFCEEELRLNRRTAPAIYLGVVPITGDAGHPRIGGAGPAIEWAVRMRRFPANALFADLARDGRLTTGLAEALAANVAAFHASLPRAVPPQDFGSVAAVVSPALDNFREIEALPGAARFAAIAAELQRWTRLEAMALTARLVERREAGFVREAHGDLHLANAVLAEGRPMLFDGIEFDPRLRWIDVIADAAFAYMDLLHHGLPRQAWAFANRYLEETGDYEAIPLLRFHAAYRAVVRAKIAAIDAARAAGDEAVELAAASAAESYLRLARDLTRPAARSLVVMHGLSGSGKTTVARRLAQALRAVCLRSDVERKRLHGLAAGARTASALREGIYSIPGSDRTYGRLALLAGLALDAGYPVIVDAAFLDPARRKAFAEVARSHGAAFEIAACVASTEVLRGRITGRERAGSDASEAGLRVLELQAREYAPLDAAERIRATVFDTSTPAWEAVADRMGERLRLEASADAA